MKRQKTAAEIQADIDLIRLAYRRRSDAFNFRLRPTLQEATPYIMVGSIAAGAVAYIITLFTL